MKITAYTTDKVTNASHDLYALLDAALPALPENCVVAIAAKVVSLCEGRVAAMDMADKDALVKREAARYLPGAAGKYGVSFAITRGLLVPAAGIDESNTNGQYVLWPQDIQASANAIREHLVTTHHVQHVGVVITDSSLRPLQWGTTGIAIAASGFEQLKDYAGQADIFGQPMRFQKAGIANGLAAAAVTLMGEGSEQTPFAVIEDTPFVTFQSRNPTPEELTALRIEPEDDLFWPLLKDAPWLPGDRPD